MLNIELYECGDDFIIMVMDAHSNDIIWCMCGYTSFYQVMAEIRNLTMLEQINELDVYVSCAPRTFEQIDNMFVLCKDKQRIRERLRMSGKLLTTRETSIDMKGEY